VIDGVREAGSAPLLVPVKIGAMPFGDSPVKMAAPVAVALAPVNTGTAPPLALVSPKQPNAKNGDAPPAPIAPATAEEKTGTAPSPIALSVGKEPPPLDLPQIGAPLFIAREPTAPLSVEPVVLAPVGSTPDASAASHKAAGSGQCASGRAAGLSGAAAQ
jgi:hypothetical protein